MRALLLALVLLGGPVWAVQPDEMLADRVLEARAREISQGLRCPVCQNESIDESNAALSRELRIVLRERLVAGDSDAEAVAFLVDRYGEFVLLRPNAEGANMVLWLAAPAMLLVALGIGWTSIRRRRAVLPEDLTEAERKRIREIIGE